MDNKGCPRVVPKFVGDINMLLEILDQFVDSDEDDILIVVAPYDTGIYHIIEKEYSNNNGENICVIDYLTFTVTASFLSKYLNSRLKSKIIIVLTPYQYRFLRNNAERLHVLHIVSDQQASNFVKTILYSAKIINAYISPNTRNNDIRSILKKLIYLVFGHYSYNLEKIFIKTKNIIIRVNFEGRSIKSLAPYLALLMSQNIVEPIPDSRLNTIRRKLGQIKTHILKTYEALANFLIPVLGIQPIIGGAMLGAIPLLYMLLQEHSINSIAHIPYYKLEELEEKEQVPPGTFTMLGRYKNPLDILEPAVRLIQIAYGEVEGLEKKIEDIKKKLQNMIKILPKGYQRKLEKLLVEIEEVNDEINKIWSEIEKIKVNLKKLSQEYAALPITTLEELIHKIDYHSGGRKNTLLDLRDQSKELGQLIDKILEETLKAKPIIITGPSGSGKTSLLILTVKQALEQGIPVYLLVAKETRGAIPLSEVETPYILIYDDVKPEQITLMEWIVKNKETLNLVATARYHILVELLQSLKIRAGLVGRATIKQEDIEKFWSNNIVFLGLEKEYVKTFLSVLLNNYNIKYNEKVLNIILEKATQKYGPQSSRDSKFKTGNLYYITLIVKQLDKTLPLKQRILTKNIAESTPTGLYSIIAREFLEAIGLTIPTPGKIEIPYDLSTLTRYIVSSHQETPISNCVKKVIIKKALSSEEAFAKCFVAYLIPRVALSHLGKRRMSPSLYREIQRVTAQLLGLHPDVVPDPPYLRGETPHYSHQIFLRMDPLDPEALEAKPLYAIINGSKSKTEWYYIKWIITESYKTIKNIIIKTTKAEEHIIENAPQATTTLLLDKIINKIKNIKLKQNCIDEILTINITNKKILYKLHLISKEDYINSLVDALEHGIDASWIFHELVIHNDFNNDKFTRLLIDYGINLLKKGIDVSIGLEILALMRPELFTEDHKDVLKHGIGSSWISDTLKMQNDSREFLQSLFNRAINLFKKDFFILYKVVLERPELLHSECNPGLFECEFVYWYCYLRMHGYVIDFNYINYIIEESKLFVDSIK